MELVAIELRDYFELNLQEVIFANANVEADFFAIWSFRIFVINLENYILVSHNEEHELIVAPF